MSIENYDTDDSKNEIKHFKLTNSLDSNISMIKEILSDDDTLIVRFIENHLNKKIKCALIFFDGMIDKEIINRDIIQPLILSNEVISDLDVVDSISRQVLFAHNVEKTSAVDKFINAIYEGNAVIILEGYSEALIASSKGGETRAITEPESERVLHGPREGFTESLSTNITLIRRKLKTPDLKCKMRVIGEKSKTKICVCYIKGIANENILRELYKRLDSIEIDGLMDSGYIQELIRDHPLTPFKTLGSTERPDVVAAKMLEGRIALIADGSPFVITVPHIFIEYFQSSDDYYINFYYSSIGRMLRIFGFVSTISLPALYLGITTFHQEIIPTPLLYSLSASREGVPFPTTVELLLMLLVFELLREAGLRMPTFIGQAVSIVGAIVIGSAAVDAKIVSAPMVIVIAFTGITGLMIPRLKGAIILLRIIFLLLSSVLGIYGYGFGMSGLLIHLFELRTFGIPYMYKLMFLDPLEDIKDTVIRAPWWQLKYRPRLFTSNTKRIKSDRGKKN